MSKTRHRMKKTDRDGDVGRTHGSAWNAMEWYVPFADDHAIIYHGHEHADDHSACGPQVFCCPKAAHVFLQRFPDHIFANSEWQFTDGQHLVSWMCEDGPHVYYFYFCDPQDRNLLLFSGVTTPKVRNVLLKRRSLDDYIDTAFLIQ